MQVAPTSMNGEKYTMLQLKLWWMEAQQKDGILILTPCNPWEVPFLQVDAIIQSEDDFAAITQWVGGLPAGDEE